MNGFHKEANGSMVYCVDGTRAYVRAYNSLDAARIASTLMGRKVRASLMKALGPYAQQGIGDRGYDQAVNTDPFGLSYESRAVRSQESRLSQAERDRIDQTARELLALISQ